MPSRNTSMKPNRKDDMSNTTVETTALVVRRTMPYAPQVLFRAFSDPEVMNRWFHGGKGWSVEASNDFRVGKDFTVNMRPDKGEVHPHTGTYKEIVPDEKIVFTWNSAHAKNSVVTLLFRKVTDGTELILTHEFLAEDMIQPHVGGWNDCLDSLEATLKAA